MGVFTTAALTAAVGNKISAATFWNGQVRDLINGFGAHTAYTTTFSGFTVGNGTASAGYTQIQKQVTYFATFVFGTTSAGAAAVPTFTLPVAAASGSTVNQGTHRGLFIDSSAGTIYNAVPYASAATTIGLWIPGTSGLLATPSATTPFGVAWATGDTLIVSGTYPAA
jgi:hypothetical protein